MTSKKFRLYGEDRSFEYLLFFLKEINHHIVTDTDIEL